MITKFSVAVVLAVLFGSPSLAQDAGSQKFLKEAMEGNFAEVEMGKLSQKQGASEGRQPGNVHLGSLRGHLDQVSRHCSSTNIKGKVVI